MIGRITFITPASLALCARARAQLCPTPFALSGTDDALGPGQGAGIHFGQGINGTLLSATSCINFSGDVVFRAANDQLPAPYEGVWKHSSASGTNAHIALTGETAGG